MPTLRGRGYASLASWSTFSHSQWPESISAGGQWLVLDVASTGPAGGTVGMVAGRRREPQ